MNSESNYGVEGMTRQQFERDLRIRLQHDNIRAVERGIDVNESRLARQEVEIQERVKCNYGNADCPGCGAFDVGMSEVNFVQGCIGCAARMKAANGLGPTPAPEYFARIHPLPEDSSTQGADAPAWAFRCDGKLWVVHDPDVAMRWQAQGFQVTEVTQGADARPVAIYQRRKVNRIYWRDVPKEKFDEVDGSDASWEARIVYATRDASPSADAKRLKQLEHALVYVAHSMHSEPQYMLAEGITLGDVSFVRVKVADIDVSVDLPESVARAMYEAARQATATKDDERRIAIAPREKT